MTSTSPATNFEAAAERPRRSRGEVRSLPRVQYAKLKKVDELVGVWPAITEADLERFAGYRRTRADLTFMQLGELIARVSSGEIEAVVERTEGAEAWQLVKIARVLPAVTA